MLQHGPGIVGTHVIPRYVRINSLLREKELSEEAFYMPKARKVDKGSCD